MQLVFDREYVEGINGWELKNKSMTWEKDSFLLEDARCRALALGNNKLTDISFVHSLRKNCHLRYLDLCYNHIGDKGAKVLATVLKTNKSLQSVFLFENKIGDGGAKALAGALKGEYLSEFGICSRRRISRCLILYSQLNVEET